MGAKRKDKAYMREITVEELFQVDDNRHTTYFYPPKPYRDIEVKPRKFERYSDEYEKKFEYVAINLPINVIFSMHEYCKSYHMDPTAFLRHLKPWLKNKGWTMERIDKKYRIRMGVR